MDLLRTCRLLLECVLLGCSELVSCQMRRCRYHERPREQRYHPFGDVRGSVQLCNFTRCCVGFYRVRAQGELEVDTLACNLRESCSDVGCVTFRNFLKCVCDGDLCNNLTSWTPEEVLPLQYPNVGVLAAGLVMVLLVLCVAVFTLRITCREAEKPCSPTDPLCVEIEDIELLRVLGRGSFATVWEGRHQGVLVAVKVFPSAWKQIFGAERELHHRPFMTHPNIVQILDSGSVGACRVIILEYVPHGSLHSFLSMNCSSWTSSVTLCLSLSQGLSYLHKQDVCKPAVSHGDLSSSNILVKEDGTCVLCDFGCSFVLGSGSGPQRRPYGDRWTGTLRYMSPEILDGGVMLNSPWSLQGDVYALGLVLWEVWMRCSDLFGGTAPAHLLPYEEELGPSVTLESLLQHVLTSDRRPVIPEAWQRHQQGAAVAELLSCCWDSEPDARLSAASVVDRLASFQPTLG